MSHETRRIRNKNARKTKFQRKEKPTRDAVQLENLSSNAGKHLPEEGVPENAEVRVCRSWGFGIFGLELTR